MQVLRLLVGFALGLAAGWIGHGLLAPEQAPPRASRPPVTPTPHPASQPLAAEQPPPVAETTADTPAATEDTLAATRAQEEAELEAIHEWFRTQGKQWKGWAGMQARQKAEALLAKLPFDAERERRIQELLQEEAERMAEEALLMLLGEAELDPNAFSWFLGLPAELSPHMEGELATFLNDGEIQIVRAEVKQAHEKQMRDLADMQIGMMNIGDLSDDQRTRLRDVFIGKDTMTEQMSRFAEITRDRDRLRRLLKGEGLQEEMERGFSATRRRVRDILNNEQYGKYEIYEKQMAKQAEMGLRMMASVLEKAHSGAETPAGR